MYKVGLIGRYLPGTDAESGRARWQGPHAALLAPAAYADSFTAAARAALSRYDDDGVDSGAMSAAPPTHPQE